MPKKLFLLLYYLYFTSIVHSQSCPPGALSSTRTNKLYLYFPMSEDSSFREFSPVPDVMRTSPLDPFNIVDLDSILGTTDDLINSITQIVIEDYCEFDVEVISTRTLPSPTGARWQIIGIGSVDSPTFGIAERVDLNDLFATDFGRVWAGAFRVFRAPGRVLHGTNSTLERWSRAIGHTVSHEAGHNYGLDHINANPVPISTEDVGTNHIMATSNSLTGEHRTRKRHMSNTSYGILAHNIGLNVQTIYNWDFINPNSTNAFSIKITLLSTATALTINSSYTGGLNPWRTATISRTGSTRTMRGVLYNEFTLTFSDPNDSWSNGPEGQVPPAVEFHVGASFSESDPVIPVDTRLLGSGGGELALHPRVIGFNTGEADFTSGEYEVRIFKSSRDSNSMEDTPVFIRELEVNYLPRVASIETMISNREGKLSDVHNIPFDANGQCSRMPTFELNSTATIKIGRLSDPRYIDITYDSTGCVTGFTPNDSIPGSFRYCPHGTALSLFPSTSVYITATVVDTNGIFFNPQTESFDTGWVESRVFYQFSGKLPDFNENGIDDLLDIRNGASLDTNKNGIPDEIEPSIPGPPTPATATQLPWWVYVIFATLLLIIFYLLRKRRLD